MRSALILVSTLALGACNVSADAERRRGETARQSYAVGEFQSVALAGSHDVIVTVGQPASVRAEGDADVIEKLDIRVENGTLKIGTRKGANFNIGFGRDRSPVTVYVTAPALNAAAVAGSGDLRIDRIEGDRFNASIAGSGDLHVATLKVNSADFSVAGSGDIRAGGTANMVKASVAGSGDIDIGGLKSRRSDVNIVGSGDIRSHATETASVTIMGSGNVTMAGGAKCAVSKRGSGEANCS